MVDEKEVDRMGGEHKLWPKFLSESKKTDAGEVEGEGVIIICVLFGSSESPSTEPGPEDMLDEFSHKESKMCLFLEMGAMIEIDLRFEFSLETNNNSFKTRTLFVSGQFLEVFDTEEMSFFRVTIDE